MFVLFLSGVIRVRTGRGRTRGTGRGRTRGTGRGRTRGIRIGPRTAERLIIQNPASIGPPGVIRVRTGRGRTRGTGRGRTRGTGRGRTRGIRIGPRTAGSL